MRQLVEPFGVTRSRNGGNGVPELIGAQIGLVVGAAIDEVVDERIARLGQAFNAVAMRPHGVQQGKQRGRCIEPDRIADLRCLAAAIGEDEGDTLVFRARVAQCNLARRDAGQPAHPVGQRHVVGLAPNVALTVLE